MALSDKDMASDVLDLLKHQAVGRTRAAIECSDPNLRNTFFQARAQTEQVQWEMYRLMEQKGWYLPSPKADPNQIQQVRQFYQGVPVQAATAYGPDGGGGVPL